MQWADFFHFIPAKDMNLMVGNVYVYKMRQLHPLQSAAKNVIFTFLLVTDGLV